MADNVWEAPVVSAGERRLRRSGNAPSLRLSRALKVSLALFVLLVLLGSAHSLWTIHRMHQNQQALSIAARTDQHFSRMVERAEHYESIAPRNYTDFNRDVELYYDSLRRDIDTMDWMVADLAQRDVAFNPDRWNDFRNQLEEEIGYEADRPRLEWAAEHLIAESGPLLVATGAMHSNLQQRADAWRSALWISSIALTLATAVLAFVIAWLFRERVLSRIRETSRSVRRMADGEFKHSGFRRVDDELGQLESDVRQLAHRTGDLVDVLDTLNRAETLQEAIDRLPDRLTRQFCVTWLGLVEIHDGRVRLRISQPSRETLGIEQPGTGWSLDRSLLAEARKVDHAVFARLRNGDGELGQDDALLVQLRDAGLVSVALLPVHDRERVTAGVLLASRSADAFTGWRGRWLKNVGHLIAQGLYRSIHIEHLGISMVRGLAELAEKRDPTTGQHLDRMQRIAGRIARRMVEQGHVDTARSPRFAEQVEIFAPLHDIGKVGISDSILLKPGALTASEIDEMRRHPQIGAEVLMTAGDRLGAEGEKLLAHATDIALYHHEKYDGSGYPHGLVGETIPLSARIVAVADVFDALTSQRPYKKAWSVASAVEHMERDRGRHFDPLVLDAFHDCIDDIRHIRELFDDPPVGKMASAGRS